MSRDMKRRLAIRWSGVVAVAIVIAVGAVAIASNQRVASGGDRYRVSARRLRSELAKTGLDVRYVHPRHEPTSAVVGVARSLPANPFGFEYQLYRSSDEASVSALGKLKAGAFGWPKPHLGVIFEPVVRGVLGNVAYAIYERSFLREKEGSRAKAWEVQLTVQRTQRELDDALFNTFPPRDPYANALSNNP